MLPFRATGLALAVVALAAAPGLHAYCAWSCQPDRAARVQASDAGCHDEPDPAPPGARLAHGHDCSGEIPLLVGARSLNAPHPAGTSGAVLVVRTDIPPASIVTVGDVPRRSLGPPTFLRVTPLRI
jgi:hypothetical protein